MPPSRRPPEHVTTNEQKLEGQSKAIALAVRADYYDHGHSLKWVVERYSEYRSRKWIIDIVFYRDLIWLQADDVELQWIPFAHEGSDLSHINEVSHLNSTYREIIRSPDTDDFVDEE